MTVSDVQIQDMIWRHLPANEPIWNEELGRYQNLMDYRSWLFSSDIQACKARVELYALIRNLLEDARKR
mgnify:CR=1 FL=1|jgi:hypothetical protein